MIFFSGGCIDEIYSSKKGIFHPKQTAELSRLIHFIIPSIGGVALNLPFW